MGSFLQSDILKIIGICCSVLATAVFVHSKTTLGRNYSPCYDSYLPIEIVDRGIYRYIRHPIYVSNILNFAAMFLFSGSYLVGLNLLGLIYFYTRSARLEEVRLKAAFTEYASYVNRSGMFLPNLRQLLRL